MCSSDLLTSKLQIWSQEAWSLLSPDVKSTFTAGPVIIDHGLKSFTDINFNQIHLTLCAFGIIGKVITRPWMQLVAQVTNILDLNPHFEEAIQKLHIWSPNAGSLLYPDLKSNNTAASVFLAFLERSLQGLGCNCQLK